MMKLSVHRLINGVFLNPDKISYSFGGAPFPYFLNSRIGTYPFSGLWVYPSSQLIQFFEWLLASMYVHQSIYFWLWVHDGKAYS